VSGARAGVAGGRRAGGGRIWGPREHGPPPVPAGGFSPRFAGSQVPTAMRGQLSAHPDLIWRHTSRAFVALPRSWDNFRPRSAGRPGPALAIRPPSPATLGRRDRSDGGAGEGPAGDWGPPRTRPACGPGGPLLSTPRGLPRPTREAWTIIGPPRALSASHLAGTRGCPAKLGQFPTPKRRSARTNARHTPPSPATPGQQGRLR
jgi:hypothetical protein